MREGYHYFEVEPPTELDEWHHLLAISCEGTEFGRVRSALFRTEAAPDHFLVAPDAERVYLISSYGNLHYLTGGFFTALVEALLYDDFLVVHGAAVSRERGMILPGALRCGKSTLTLALLGQGFELGSDDVVLVNRSTRRVHSYPRLINVRQESLTLVPGLFKEYPNMSYAPSFGEPRWFLDKSDWAAAPFECSFVVFPRLGGAVSRLVPVTKADAALRLIANSFYPISPWRRFTSTAENLETIARLLERTECYELVQGDLSDTLELLLGLVQQPSAS